MCACQELDCNFYYIPHGRQRRLLIKLYPWIEQPALRSGITVASEVYPRRGYC